MSEARSVKTFSLGGQNARAPAVKAELEKISARRRNYSAADTRRLQANLHADLLDAVTTLAFHNKITVTDIVGNLLVDYLIQMGHDADQLEATRPPHRLPKEGAL